VTESLPARISKIEQALAVVETPDQAKQVIAIADAAIAYAKSLGREFVDARRKAEALKLDAERRLGELLLSMPKAIGARGIGTSAVPKENRTGTLADLGIDKKESARAQKLATLPAASLRETKRLLKQSIAALVPQVMQDEGEIFRRQLASPAAKEAFSAFLEKRKPDFSKFS